MSKKILISNLDEIRALRFRCNNCGTAVELPVSVNVRISSCCINCGKEFANKYIEALYNIKKALICIDDMQKINNHDMQIEVVTEYQN